MVFGAVETDQQLGDPVPDRAGGDALDHKADALRHGKPSIAQHGAHQVIGEDLRPIGAHRDRRPLPGLADDPVGLVGVPVRLRRRWSAVRRQKRWVRACRWSWRRLSEPVPVTWSSAEMPKSTTRADAYISVPRRCALLAISLMFCGTRHRMLASMSEIDWSDVGMSELPTGTVTLLLADVEGSTRLWETQPDEMTPAIARLDQAVSEAIAAHDGVRPVEQGEGDSFVIAFARASDAVACALDLQRAPLAPIKLRIGVHTGEVRLRDEGNYVGPAINRTARLRDLAHGGQTVLSAATSDLVIDELPADAWLTDLGSHPLRDLPRPERVVQLCHPDLCNDFPPLRTPSTVVAHNLPAHLTNFVGRQAEIASLRETWPTAGWSP